MLQRLREREREKDERAINQCQKYTDHQRRILATRSFAHQAISCSLPLREYFAHFRLFSQTGYVAGLMFLLKMTRVGWGFAKIDNNTEFISQVAAAVALFRLNSRYPHYLPVTGLTWTREQRVFSRRHSLHQQLPFTYFIRRVAVSDFRYLSHPLPPPVSSSFSCHHHHHHPQNESSDGKFHRVCY